ncbi:putative serine/threonine protein phosphatase [Microlunatus phosphovorus NM-1]|uniref:Putative serine/threonine protein phosphatase n=1 Tax=Microlunatus phosphovorus (strain ATCC 700054 / DSM 10555 / JCM 9379 / NBRC 101784 / NCIMB 13414 / VKM Ac-1990 / NM-1) TaxID=1032480 RepID=F5XLF5_MICPN|nr:putative serine/threonine protein phosphatase [Microlunatus phosphovorus NM-1]
MRVTTDATANAESGHCPSCGAAVAPTARFCEACGAPLAPTEDATEEAAAELPIELTASVPSWQRHAGPANLGGPIATAPRPCLNCGGIVDADGYCETCGTKAPSERDHYVEQPATWVAACCDRGIRHSRNEDAVAVAASAEPGQRAVLVVCDGVSTADDSDVASLAAARAARDVLVGSRPAGLGVRESQVAALEAALVKAAEKANAAVLATTAEDASNPASCTYVAAVVEGDLCVVGNIGDSRAYWIPDPGAGDPIQLTVDDSVAQLRIAAGVPREVAEEGPQAHAILKWLGRDTPDFRPTTSSTQLTGPGWVLVCSDGLWNYASKATELQALITQLSATAGSDPLPLAEAMVRWACDQGGRDNISVALARHAPVEATS